MTFSPGSPFLAPEMIHTVTCGFRSGREQRPLAARSCVKIVIVLPTAARSTTLGRKCAAITFRGHRMPSARRLWWIFPPQKLSRRSALDKGRNRTKAPLREGSGSSYTPCSAVAGLGVPSQDGSGFRGGRQWPEFMARPGPIAIVTSRSWGIHGKLGAVRGYGRWKRVFVLTCHASVSVLRGDLVGEAADLKAV